MIKVDFPTYLPSKKTAISLSTSVSSDESSGYIQSFPLNTGLQGCVSGTTQVASFFLFLFLALNALILLIFHFLLNLQHFLQDRKNGGREVVGLFLELGKEMKHMVWLNYLNGNISEIKNFKVCKKVTKKNRNKYIYSNIFIYFS